MVVPFEIVTIGRSYEGNTEGLREIHYRGIVFALIVNRMRLELKVVPILKHTGIELDELFGPLVVIYLGCLRNFTGETTAENDQSLRITLKKLMIDTRLEIEALFVCQAREFAEIVVASFIGSENR